MAAKIEYACNRHPTYMGVRAPSADCPACRLLYSKVHQAENLTYEFHDGSKLLVNTG
jgi:hypothetical protein